MAELIYNVEKIFGECLLHNQHFNIPEYQRGYKWSGQQIIQLLEDINQFENAGDDELFYCLQNITLVLNKDGQLNVIDGQQRLTTVALLLIYLDKHEIVKEKIKYSVRKNTDEFLQKLAAEQEMLGKIIDSTDFTVFLKESISDYDFQDIFFMYTAIRAINSWFLVKKQNFKLFSREQFTDKLLKNVKFIVNRISNITEQQLFKNLNTSKVQLDGSDLIRAILITRVAKQEIEEFDFNEINDIVRLNERRVRIGWEIDELNAWWSKKQVSEYFSTFTNQKTGENETIKFNQQDHPINLLYKIWSETQNFKEIKLSDFEPKSITALDLYTSIVSLHRTLKDWYEDREIYHFLGFLFSLKQNKNYIKTIWQKWNQDDIKRNEFVTFLKYEIQKNIFATESNDSTDETDTKLWLDRIADYRNENSTNWYEIPQVVSVLLLLDIIEHSAEKKSGIPIPFLKPAYFKLYNEDKEHIYPCTPSQFKDFKKQKGTFDSILKYIETLNTSFHNKIIWNIKENEWNNLNEELKNTKLSELKKEIHSKRPINSIGNIVLLNFSINRGFGNDYYIDKRISVIKNIEHGEYVRQHTLNVFVKQTEASDLNDWKMEDINKNANRIIKSLEDFFNVNL